MSSALSFSYGFNKCCSAKIIRITHPCDMVHHILSPTLIFFLFIYFYFIMKICNIVLVSATGMNCGCLSGLLPWGGPDGYTRPVFWVGDRHVYPLWAPVFYGARFAGCSWQGDGGYMLCKGLQIICIINLLIIYTAWVMIHWFTYAPNIQLYMIIFQC